MKTPKLFRRLSKSKLLRGTATLFSGKVTAEALLIASAPIISRLYTPSDYGAAALVLAVATIISPLSTLGYGTASQLVKADLNARRLLNIALTSCIAFSAVLILLLSVVEGLEIEFFTQMGVWMWAIPVLFLLNGVESALESWNTRMRQFKVQATTYFSSAVAGTSGRIGFGLVLGSSVGGLVVSFILGLATRITVLTRWSGLFRPSKVPEEGLIPYRKLVSDYRDFPLYSTPTQILSGANKRLPLLFFGALFSPAIAGFYAMADRLFFRPMMILQNSFRTVFTQHLAGAVNQGRSITRPFIKATVLTGSLMCAPALVLAIYGQDLIVFLLSERWRQAGVFIEISSPLMIFAAAVIPANAALVVCRQQRRLLALQIVTIAMLLGALFGSYFIWRTPEAAVKSIVLVLAVRYTYLMWVAYKVARHRDVTSGSATHFAKRNGK
jgi:O-antigen/teichoic acid export membrane protein